VSAAKLTMIGTISAAVVTAGGVVLAANHNSVSVSNTSGAQTLKPTLNQTSPQGSFDQVSINDAGTEVTVAGSAEKDVDSVVVLIGPRASGGQYWANSANVVDGQWKLAVATDPHVPVPYEIKAYYRQRPSSAPVHSASYVTFAQATPSPTPTPSPAAPVVNCAEQYGDTCFNGPGWGPPSVYQSGH
jgi:hypothetical protein